MPVSPHRYAHCLAANGSPDAVHEACATFASFGGRVWVVLPPVAWAREQTREIVVVPHRWHGATRLHAIHYGCPRVSATGSASGSLNSSGLPSPAVHPPAHEYNLPRNGFRAPAASASSVPRVAQPSRPQSTDCSARY